MKKVIVSFLVLAIAFSMYACGNVPDVVDETSIDETTSGEAVQVEIESIEEVKEEKQVIKKRKPIKVAVVGPPSSDILKFADEALEYSDYCIEQVICDDFVQSNELVNEGEVLASLCLNQVLLDSYNQVNESDLTILERIYVDPLAIFPAKVTDLNQLTNGETIAVVEGDVNVARALYLLEQKGIVELKEGALYQATMEDVISNPYNVSIEQVSIQDEWPDEKKYGMIISDYNRAILSGIDPATALGEENRNSKLFDMFAVSLVVKKDDADNNKLKLLLKAINSEDVEEKIKDSFYSSVLDYK